MTSLGKRSFCFCLSLVQQLRYTTSQCYGTVFLCLAYLDLDQGILGSLCYCVGKKVLYRHRLLIEAFFLSFL